MAIAFRAAGTGGDGSSSLSVTKPAGTVEGDFIVISYTNDGGNEATTPTGFTKKYSIDNPSDNMLTAVFYKVAGASEPASYTVDGYTGGAKASIESYYDTVGGGTWVTSTEVTASGQKTVNVGPLTTIDDCFMLLQAGCDSTSTVVTPPSGMTNATTSPAGSTSVAVDSYYEAITTGGSESRSIEYTVNDNSNAGLFYISYEASGPSISQADTTPEDSVEQTVTCTDMTGPITAATLGGVSILSDLSGTDPSVAITYTYDISAQTIETNQSQPRLGIPVDLIFTTATDGAVSTSVTIGPKTGWAYVELEDTLNKDVNGYLATIEAAEGITITNADASYYDTSDNANITVNGLYTSDLTTAGELTKSILQVGATSPATSYSDNFYPYGESGGGGTDKKLTYSKLTGVKLTSTKLEASKL